MQSAAITSLESPPLASTRAATVPWYCAAVVFGATCILLGVIWDISWHQSIGRDTFWTPAHMVIYLGGTLGGLSCGWLAIKTTFWGTAEERAGSVKFWGARAPLGAWVTIWGAMAMLTSAPFDNWWHDAYGLDVQIISPPHSILAAGMYHVVAGAILLVLSLQNRAAGVGRTTGSWLLLFAGGVLLGMAATMVMQYNFPNQQHTALYYQISCPLYLIVLVPLARASRLRWPATTIAAIYIALSLAMVWLLPLFAATPKLAPIYNPITHFVPPPFPQLLIVPALAIDLLLRWLGGGRGWWRDWVLAGLIAVAFTGLFLATQWFFAKFLLSPAAANWFFVGDRYWSYGAQPGVWRNEFWQLKTDPLTLKGLGLALLLAFGATRIGLWSGKWQSKVQR